MELDSFMSSHLLWLCIESKVVLGLAPLVRPAKLNPQPHTGHAAGLRGTMEDGGTYCTIDWSNRLFAKTFAHKKAPCSFTHNIITTTHIVVIHSPTCVIKDLFSLATQVGYSLYCKTVAKCIQSSSFKFHVSPDFGLRVISMLLSAQTVPWHYFNIWDLLTIQNAAAQWSLTILTWVTCMLYNHTPILYLAVKPV